MSYPQDKINADIFKRLDDQDKNLAQIPEIREDVAYIKGLLDGRNGAPIQTQPQTHMHDSGSWMNRQSVITVALASLITTVGAILSNAFGSN